MKKEFLGFSMFVLTIMVCFFLVSCKSCYKPVLHSQDGINFSVTTLAAALQSAKTQNKPLFIFAHASWCPTCKRMEKEILIQKALGTIYNQSFVNVAIDIDSPTGKELQKTYPIRATPTLFFFKSNGGLAKKNRRIRRCR